MPESFDDRRSLLLQWLQTALEIELATIPPYFVALLSIKRPSNRVAAEVIRGVMMEEMLHFGLIANIINAVGGQPKISSETLPRYPLLMNFEGNPFKDRDFEIPLASFGSTTIETFLKIELPEEPKRDRNLFTIELHVPGFTIGDFYHRIGALLAELEVERPGQLFVGDPSRQLHPDFYWAGGGMLRPVNDLASAQQALETVVTQGEAAPAANQVKTLQLAGGEAPLGHYFRFSEIANGRRYQSGDSRDKPTGEPIDVDFNAVFPIKENPTAADFPAGSELASLNEAFNVRYTDMMLQLNEAINGVPLSLYTAIMNGMHGLPPLAHAMMMKAVPNDPQGRGGCPTFEWCET